MEPGPVPCDPALELHVPEAFDLIASGKINPAPLLNGELPLEQVETALKKMIAGEVVKVVINPDL